MFLSVSYSLFSLSKLFTVYVSGWRDEGGPCPVAKVRLIRWGVLVSIWPIDRVGKLGPSP